MRSEKSQIAVMENLNSTENTSSILLFRSYAVYVQCSKNQPCRKMISSVALSCMMRTIWPTRLFAAHTTYLSISGTNRIEHRQVNMAYICSAVKSCSTRRLRQPVLSQYEKFNLLLQCSNIVHQSAGLALSVRSDDHKRTFSLRMKHTVLSLFRPTMVTKH
jgi:hypothetical protein